MRQQADFRREGPGSRKISIFFLVFLVFFSFATNAQVIYEDEQNTFGTSGYLRTGWGRSEGNETQAHFQMPGAQNKFSLGNQADTYGELEFDYTRTWGTNKEYSLDLIWMTSIYEDFGTSNQMSYNFTEQLYFKLNNVLGKNEIFWAGKRFYDRRAVHMLDRQWVNPGQTGWGVGMENLLNNDTPEDIKFGLWAFDDENIISFRNGEQNGRLRSYSAEGRWINKPFAENWDLSVSVYYTYRQKNKRLDYDDYHGFGVVSWVDYEKNNITHTSALLLRYGPSIPINHWTGMSDKENPANNNLVTNDLSDSYFVEFNNNFLYDDFDRFALNGIVSYVFRDFGTRPYSLANNGTRVYLPDRGTKLHWLALGARGMWYLSDNFKLSLEYTYEYINNHSVDAEGSLNKIAFTPELSLQKGFYSRPVLRPLVTYAFWSDGLRGQIGTSPQGASFANKTSGFTYGLQFEIWW